MLDIWGWRTCRFSSPVSVINRNRSQGSVSQGILAASGPEEDDKIRDLKTNPMIE